MNFVVTGGTGFVGRALVGRILKDGHDVVILTRDKKKAAEFAANPKIFIQEFQNSDYTALPAILERLPRPVDGVFHLAANLKYIGSRELLFKDNVEFTRALLEWSARSHVKFLVYTSTIDAMGPNCSGERPLTEENPCRPLSTYGWSKLQAEKLVASYGKTTPLKTVSLRLGNVYGPGSKFIVADIAEAIASDQKDPMVRYYQQIKDCIVHLGYVDDMVEGIYQAAFAKYESGDVFILAGDEPTTIATLFDYISAMTNKNFEPPPHHMRDDLFVKYRKIYYLRFKKKSDRVTYFKSGNWFVSSEKAKKTFQFQPRMPLKEGILKTLELDFGHFPETRDREKQPPDNALDYTGIGCWGIA